jgi:hypothetical protein
MANKKQEPPLDRLSPREESYLKAAKEIAVKFIETGRMSPNTFEENFGRIYQVVREAVENK